MNLQIAIWGNGLALRIPSASVRQVAFAAELGHARAALPMGSSAIGELRQGVRD